MTATGWLSCTLGDAVTFQRGFDITKKEQQDGEYEVISSSGPKSTHVQYKVAGPGVVIGRKGTLGTVFFTDKPYWPHDTTLWVKDFHGNDPKFVYFFLQTMGLERFDAGAANPSLNRNHIHTLPIKWPVIGIQRRIATILSAYDDLIENNLRRIKILEEMAQNLYREWFVKFRFPGHEKVRLVDSELGKIPQAWRVDTLDKLAEFENGDRGKNYPKLSDFVEIGIPFINAGHLVANSIDLRHVNRITEDTFNRLSRGKIKPGDILFCVRGSLGRIARVETQDQGAIASSLVIIRSLEHCESGYLFYSLSGTQGQQLVAELDNGAAQPNIAVQSLKRSRVLLPPLQLLGRFGAFVQPIWKIVALLQTQSANLEATRDLLLPKLISGELDVSELEIETKGVAA